jgi:hypothetical protein
VTTMSNETAKRADDRCLRCDGTLTSMGTEQIRTGGTAGGWKLLFGELAEVGEEMLPLEAFACQRCRMVELRVPSGSNI